MIRLESVSISHFPGISEGELSGFADVNILIGRNNSGKSTVAEAIAFALSLAKSKDPIGRDTINVWNRPHGDELRFRQEMTMPTKAMAQVGDAKFINGFPNSGQRIQRFEPSSDAKENNASNQFAQKLAVFRPPDGADERIEKSIWPRLLANRRDKELTRMLNEIFNLEAEGFQLLPDRRLVVLFPEHSVPLDLQGDGTRAAVRCLMFLAALRSTLFIIEEPECHQHPGSLERFAQALCNQAKQQEVQLLISRTVSFIDS